MKKLIAIFAFLAIGFTAFNQTYIQYPFGAAQSTTITMTGATSTLAVTNQVTYATGTMSINTTLNLTKISGIKTGALIYLKLTGNAYRYYTVKFGTYFRSNTDSICVPKSATRWYTFVYDGSYYNLISKINLPEFDVQAHTQTSKTVAQVDTIRAMCTYITYSTFDTNKTLTVVTDDNLRVGAQLFLQTTADASNRTVTFSTGYKCTALTNSATKTFTTSFIWNGSYWYAYSQKQND